MVLRTRAGGERVSGSLVIRRALAAVDTSTLGRLIKPDAAYDASKVFRNASLLQISHVTVKPVSA